MDSSFLTWIHIGLGGLASLLFLKMIIQFGLPNHPARFVSYVVALCVSTYFVGLSLTDLGYIGPWDWMRWRAIPLVAGSLCLLLQTIMMVGSFSLIQQKVISRIPLMGALLCFAIFPEYADHLMAIFLVAGGLFLIISVKKSRYQKRLYLKMLTLFLIHLGLNGLYLYPAYILGQIFLLLSVFYIFMFEHSFGIMALVDDFKQSLEGES